MSRYKSHHVLCKKTLTSPSLATRFHKNVPVISNDGPAPSSGIVPHYGQLRPHQYQTRRRCVIVFDDNKAPAPSITSFIIYKLSESSIRHYYRLKECIISVKECAMSVSSSKINFIQHLKLSDTIENGKLSLSKIGTTLSNIIYMSDQCLSHAISGMWKRSVLFGKLFSDFKRSIKLQLR